MAVDDENGAGLEQGGHRPGLVGRDANGEEALPPLAGGGDAGVDFMEHVGGNPYLLDDGRGANLRLIHEGGLGDERHGAG